MGTSEGVQESVRGGAVPRAIVATPRIGKPQLYPWSPETESRLREVQPSGWYTIELICERS
mgnify:CR=1 FL=1